MMSTALFTDAGAYFARLGGGTVLRWRPAVSGWIKDQSELPAGAEQIGFETLPEPLREEVLAVLARAEAVQGPMGVSNN